MAHHLQHLKWYYFMTSARILECEKCAIIDINTSHRCYLLAFMILNVVNTFSIGKIDERMRRQSVVLCTQCSRVREWGNREQKKRTQERTGIHCVWIVFVCVAFVHATCSLCSMRHLFDAKRMPCHLRQADTLNERLLIIVCFMLNCTNKKSTQKSCAHSEKSSTLNANMKRRN